MQLSYQKHIVQLWFIVVRHENRKYPQHMEFLLKIKKHQHKTPQI